MCLYYVVLSIQGVLLTYSSMRTLATPPYALMPDCSTPCTAAGGDQDREDCGVGGDQDRQDCGVCAQGSSGETRLGRTELRALNLEKAKSQSLTSTARSRITHGPR